MRAALLCILLLTSCSRCGGAPLPKLAVSIEGNPQSWSTADLDRAGTLQLGTDSGAQSGWSLRAAVSKLGPAGASVEELSGPEGTVRITPQEWSDERRMPVLRLNKRGLFKFEWRDAQGGSAGGPSLRGVTALRLHTSRGSP